MSEQQRIEQLENRVNQLDKELKQLRSDLSDRNSQVSRDIERALSESLQRTKRGRGMR